MKTKKKFIQCEKNDTGLPYHVFMTGHSLILKMQKFFAKKVTGEKENYWKPFISNSLQTHSTSIKERALTTTG